MRGDDLFNSLWLAVVLSNLPGPVPTVRDLRALAILVKWLKAQTFTSAGYAGLAICFVHAPCFGMHAAISQEQGADGQAVI